MRFGAPRKGTTFASNPGGVEVKHRVYARFFPGALRQLALGSVLTALGLVGAIATKGTSLVALLVGVRFAARGYRLLQRAEDHFQNGCALPGVVVATDPITVAALTDLSTGRHATYNAVKVVQMPRLAKVRGRTFATGDRVPVVAKYAGQMPTPKWDNFYPSPVAFATDDAAEIARVEASIGDREWAELNEALFQIPKPYYNGLFPVDLPVARPQDPS